ncbi:MAG TPA: serine/threonine-protein kinase [Rudaea sp.]|jgi:serine/threonine-protein kinase|nr:serine/threonine-protein kinase [Rudaea sp.]
MKQQLGHYDIVAELGRGGMGVVYKGYETSLNRYVAIKVLADSLAHDQSVKERFLREARSMAALNDPHIIQIYFIGDDDGQTYFVMEFVDGESLGSVLKRESKLKPEQAAKIIYQTAMGLTTAHDKGVIHRDIKPGNLMVSARGAVKIADFGIALSAQDFSKKLTSTGEFVGTPGYLSPEVCQGKPVDQRSDIFSLGIVLFECLAGRMPFTDESPLGLMLEVVKAEIPNVMSLNAEVDPELSRILTKMVAKDPNERYQSCHELVDDLGRHPLVAKGGPITLQTKMSPAAATMVGQKTPVSGQQPLPRTSPTPRPAVIPMPSAHQPVLQAQPTSKARSGAGLPLAIAAILLLACAGGAYAFRDRIPFLQQYMGSSATASTTTTTSAPAAVATTPATTAPSTTPAVAATTAPPVAPPPTQDTSAAAQTASVQAAQQATDASTAIAQQQPTTQPVDANAGGPAARASEVEPLRELPAAQAAESRPQQQVARVTPPPPPVAPRPHIPTVAVIGGGDNNVAEPAERMIEQALARRGYNVMDEASMPRVAHLFAGERPRYDEALNILAKLGRVDAVVIVHARDVGSEQLAAYGQVNNVVTAQLRIKAYSVDQHRPIGNDWSDAVHFSSLNAADQTNETVRPWLNEIAESLQAFHPHRDRG